jgi:hypothetical protein
MCYLIAKDVNKQGCLALQTSIGDHLASLTRQLTQEIGTTRIQLVTISRPSAYGEYEPYQFAKNEEEFIRAVRKM